MMIKQGSIVHEKGHKNNSKSFDCFRIESKKIGQLLKIKWYIKNQNYQNVSIIKVVFLE